MVVQIPSRFLPLLCHMYPLQNDVPLVMQICQILHRILRLVLVRMKQQLVPDLLLDIFFIIIISRALHIPIQDRHGPVVIQSSQAAFHHDLGVELCIERHHRLQLLLFLVLSVPFDEVEVLGLELLVNLQDLNLLPILVAFHYFNLGQFNEILLYPLVSLQRHKLNFLLVLPTLLRVLMQHLH